MLKLKLIFIALFSLNSFAVIDCDHDLSPVIENEFYIQSKGPKSKINCELLNKIHEVSVKVSEVFSTYPKVSLFLEQQGFAASFDQAKIIKVPQKFFRRNSKRKYHVQEGDSILPIFVHEYGHAIFSEMLKDEFTEFQDISQKTERMADIHIEIKKHQQDIKDPSLTGKNRKAKQDKIYKLSLEVQQIKKSLNNDKTVQKLRKIIIPYHELFADIVAVYFYEKTEIMMNAVNHPQYNKEEKIVPLRRSFTKSVTNFDQLDEKDVHGYYSPVRKLIGEKYWPKNEQDKRTFLKKIFNAISNDIRNRLNDNEKENYKSIINGLIDSINSEFQR